MQRFEYGCLSLLLALKAVTGKIAGPRRSRRTAPRSVALCPRAPTAPRHARSHRSCARVPNRAVRGEPSIRAPGAAPAVSAAPHRLRRQRCPNVLSRRAVRGGRCASASGPFDLLDTAGTARTDASFDSRDLLLFSCLGGRSCTAPGGQRLCSHRARSRMHHGVRGRGLGGHRRTCGCRQMLQVLENVRAGFQLPVSR